MKESFISFFLLLFLSVAAWGEVTKVTVNGIAYKIDTEAFTAEVTYPNASEPGTSEYTGAISIPSTITYDDTEYNVTAIGDKAFRKASITSLTIPGSVLSLGTESLRECTLASLSLPEGLLSIGSKAIYKLPNITELTVPNSVTTLEDYALAENSSLTTITFGENNGNNNWGAWVCWRSSGAYTIYLNCKKKPKLYDKDTFDGGYASTIHVNSSLYDDYIKDSKWGGTFKNVVGDLVDGETISLTDFTVNGIKYKMVSSDRVAVTYPNASKPGSSNINEYSGDIVVPSKVTYQGKTYYVRGIADYAFRFASNVNSITLPEGLIYIGEEAIYKANTISKLTVPNTVRTLRKYALAENSSLTKVTFGENIANNKWGKWVCWRESGAYDVYMICDTKPELPDDYTFDDSHASTIHVKSANESDYTADSKWNNQTISGDLSDGFCDLKSAITTNKSILTDEVGTEPGYYTAASTTDLNTAIDAAEALTTSATASEISSAIDDMTTARASLAVSPLTEGYYFIENAEKKQMLYAEAAYAAEGGLGYQDLDESKAKFYFRLTKKGSNWYMKCVKNNLYAGKPVNGNSVNEYITLTEDPEFEQVITYVSPGKFKIQSLYDGVNASYPYSVSGGWVLLSSSENNRTCWYFHPATIGEDVNGILTAEEVGNKVSNAVSNGDSYLDLSSYCLVSEYLISNMPASSNLLVKVASDSGITGTNIVNNSVCSSLVLTDGQPFGYYKDFTATSASYSRSVANTFGTICLPFAVSSDENVQYYTLNYIDGSTLYLTKADNVDAGAPAVFEMKNGTTLNAFATDAEVKGSVVNPVDGSLKLMGTFDGETITTNLANSYYIRNNQFHKATNSITVAPFRAYFTTTGSEAKAFNFCTEENETAIDNVQCSMLNVQCVYDANGMKLQSLRKGLNIVKMNNGNVQKVVVK